MNIIMSEPIRQIYSYFKKTVRIFLLVMLCVILPATQALAEEKEDYEYACIADIGCALYDPNLIGCAANGGIVGPTPVTLQEAQTRNAKIVIGIAKSYNLGQAGAIIGVMAAITESGLKNYANTGVPVSMQNPEWLLLPEPRPLGKDHDSVGIFQQRPSTGWSTIASGQAALTNQAAVWQLMNPAYAAQAFFGTPPGSGAPSALSKGVQNKPGWETRDPWVVAQSVQASAFPDGSNYRKSYDQAVKIVNDLWNDAGPVPLPVQVNGSAVGPGTAVTPSVCDTNPSNVDCNNLGSDTGGLSTTRKNVVCIAQQELALWVGGQLQPGNGYFKYSQGRAENWCADFSSWVYNKAGYPLVPGNEGNVAAVAGIKSIGERNDKFHWHPTGSYTPKPGDFAIHQNGQSHVNLVTAVKGDVITVIGGNQGKNGFTISRVTQYDIKGFSSDGINGYVSPD